MSENEGVISFIGLLTSLKPGLEPLNKRDHFPQRVFQTRYPFRLLLTLKWCLNTWCKVASRGQHMSGSVERGSERHLPRF